MAAPVVASVILDKQKISDETGFTRCNATITFDQPIVEMVAKTLGTSYQTGTTVHAVAKNHLAMKTMTCLQLKVKTCRELRLIEAGAGIVAQIDYNELYQEGANRINVYGKGLDGSWTPYQP